MLDMIYIIPENIQLLENKETKVKFYVNSKQVVDWQLAYAPPFIRVEPSSGKVDNKGIELSVFAEDSGLLEGYHNLPLSFIASGTGVFDTYARIYIAAKYLYVFLQDSIVFTQNETSGRVSLINLGNVNFIPSFKSDKQWASTTLQLYEFPPYSVASASVNVEKRMVQSGWNEALVSVSSNPPEATPLKVHYFVEPFTLLEASVNTLFLDRKYDTSFYLINAGTERIDWNLQSQNEFLTVNPESGSFNSGDSVLIQVKAIDSIQFYGIYNGSIIASCEGSSESITIQTQFNYFETDVLPQYNRLVEAVYNKELNEVVAITRMGNEIRIVDAETNAFRRVSLPDVPSGLSLFNNGQQIAVGVAGKVLIYNYQSLELIKTLPLSFNYIRPKHIVEGYGGNIYFNCINSTSLHAIDTENLTLHVYPSSFEANFADYHIALNPAMPSVFLSRDVFLQQFNLDESVATFIKSLVFNELNYKSFISSDGMLLISDDGNKYTLSLEQSETLIYSGQISAERINHLQFFNHNNKIAWVEVEQNGHISIADIHSNSVNNIINLPYLDILHNSQPILGAPKGEFVFISKDETRIISVVSYFNNIIDGPKWGVFSSPINQ